MVDRPYRIELTRAAQKDLRKLAALAAATREIGRLENEPLLGHPLSGSLAGCRALDFSGPGGAYRAIYRPDHNERLCVVFIVGPHENIYREAERRRRAL